MTNLISAWGMKPQIIILGIVLLFAKTLYAQDEPLASKRVYPVSLPIEVSNTVGGTHIDSYVVHLKKGQKLHVQVENKTDDSKVFFDTVLAGTERRFGNDSTENSWSGVVPESGDYEIRLGAYPAANYKLMVYLTRARADEPKTAFDHRVSDSTAPAYTYSRRRRGKQSAHKPIHSTPTRRRIAKKHCEA